MSSYAGPYRREDFVVGEGAGGYALVYQRPGEDPMCDIQFFDGDRDVEAVDAFVGVLRDALDRMRTWKKEAKEG